MQVRRLFVALAMAGLAASLTQVPAYAADPSPGERQLIEQADREGTARVIVQVDTLGDKQEVLDNIDRGNAEQNRTYRSFPLLALDADKAALTELAADPNVVSIQPDKVGSPSLAQSIPFINANRVHQLGFTGAGQTVAILDTGIDLDHPFFGSRIVSEACYSSTNGSNEVSLCPNGTASQTGAGSADAETAQCLNGTANICRHGTHVAGIAAGAGAGVTGSPGNGVAPGANIIAIQIYHRNNVGCDGNPPCAQFYYSDFIAGMQRVYDLRNTFTIASANLSGGDDSNQATACDGSSTKASIDLLLSVGITTTISAGNESHPNGVGEPACVSTAVTVGAIDADASGNEVDTVAGYSNRGPRLDLFAPGTSIRASVPDDAWANLSGTSMAAPHVAGAYAALRHAYPNATAATLLGYLRDTGVDITYATSGTTNATTPRIDLLAALQEGNAPPTIGADNGSVTVNEGSTANNAGGFSDPENRPIALTASTGNVTNLGGGRWSWSSPTSDGPGQSRSVTITATDDKGETATTTFQLNVNNVAPSIAITPGQSGSASEGTAFGVKATFADPGWLDSYSASIDWGDGATTSGATTVTTQGPPNDLGEINGSHTYADNGNYTVKVTVTDDDGGSSSASFPVAVSNVAPVVTIDPAQMKTITEGSTLATKASFVDLGWGDTHSAAIDWGFGAPTSGALVMTNDGPPADRGDVTGSRAYGDNGTFSVGVTVTDDDGGSGTATFPVQVTNVAPTAVIDESGATVVNGVPTFIAHKGEPIEFKGRSTDPGSDDLALGWSWGTTTSYLVNPPGTDPANSPSLQPRDVTDTKAHTFGTACNYDVGFTARDDDGGQSADSAKVIVQGNAHLTRIAPLWFLQTRAGLRIPPVDLPVSTVNCYLQVAQHMSPVFSEARDVSTMAKANAVLNIQLLNPKAEFDRQALTAWLNFADGSFDLDTRVNTDLDLHLDSTFGEVMAAAEAIRLNPASTNTQIRQQTLLLEKLNLLGI
ncbi:S8 family serine peptidase [Kribbella sandramycini]|uniref:S8 family serine peptidase n=1 Tax=Kribbella sandramycini TaxID=60450 RepID=A0A7Y4KYW1_9ACTN|nr:S8 family serine peptidase [Kribbella sandramycini]MBB6568936.1 subtilisin family serine protease [Kribbella sandramycini]NOL41218.1 S8 family serine peptidase [Kribbella sandramycini]